MKFRPRLRMLKEINKSMFDSYSVRNRVLIISHITFRDCRVHIDNLSRTIKGIPSARSPFLLTRGLAPKFHSSPLSDACHAGYTILPVLNCFFLEKAIKRNVYSNSSPADVLPVCPAEVSINLAESGTLFISSFI